MRLAPLIDAIFGYLSQCEKTFISSLFLLVINGLLLLI